MVEKLLADAARQHT